MLDKNNKASVYERSYESSIIAPSEKLLFYVKFHENFIYRELLLLREHERSECHFVFDLAFGVWGLPHQSLE